MIHGNDFLRLTLGDHPAMMEQAIRLHICLIMASECEAKTRILVRVIKFSTRCFARSAKRASPAEALRRKKNFGIDRRGNRKAKPCQHPGGIGAHRERQVAAQLREFLDIGNLSASSCLLMPRNRPHV